MRKKYLEVWADSFHEGVWCCNNIGNYFKKNGFKIKKEYLYGFQPFYTFYNDEDIIELVVYGSYKSWNPLPDKIKDLLEWGKPDFILFDPVSNEIVFAVEETAATPTGNQATQRCERQYGSAKAKIPYWYFISEFGQHIDGGIRRDSIWPTIAALKLTILNNTPCVVLHYSDENNVESYESGEGLELLFSSLFKITNNYVNNKNIYDGLESNLEKQYRLMLNFVISQWDRMIDYLPGQELLKEQSTSVELVKYALNKNTNNDLKNKLLIWPKLEQLPEEIQNKQHGKDLLKYDKLAQLFENDISNRKAYILSDNAGSGKPPKKEQLLGWINGQKRLFDSAPILNPKISFNMDINDFPMTNSGRYHITTAKNIIYLYDRWSDLYQSIVEAYPRLKNKFNSIDPNIPVFVYLSNSIKPGRLFGDPYTGQLSAFSTIFGKFDNKPRMVVVYFPHQTFSQVLKPDGQFAKNKGMTLMTELTDLIIFNEGVAVSLKNEEII